MDLLQRLFLTYKLDSKIFKLSEVISESNLILRVLDVFWVFLVLKHVQDHFFRIRKPLIKKGIKA